jgi:hypothetical protein
MCGTSMYGTSGSVASVRPQLDMPHACTRMNALYHQTMLCTISLTQTAPCTVHSTLQPCTHPHMHLPGSAARACDVSHVTAGLPAGGFSSDEVLPSSTPSTGCPGAAPSRAACRAAYAYIHTGTQCVMCCDKMSCHPQRWPCDCVGSVQHHTYCCDATPSQQQISCTLTQHSTRTHQQGIHL